MIQNYKFVLKNNIGCMIKTNKTKEKTRITPCIKEITKSALNGYFKQVNFKSSEKFKTLNLESYLSRYRNVILDSLSKNPNTKAILSVTVTMRNAEQIKNFFFNSKPNIIYEWNNKKKILLNMNKEILNEFYSKSYEGSGWAFVSFDNVSLNCGKYIPFTGGCGINKLPKWIVNKRAVVFIISEDDKCFYWCIIRHFIPKDKERGRVTKDMKKILKEDPNKYANFKGINYPTSAEDLKKFQNNNPHIHLIIFGVDEKNKRTPVIFDEQTEGIKINLLYYDNHYYYIPDLSRLISSQLSNSTGKIYFCYKCQRTFRKEEKRDKHEMECNDAILINLPEEESLSSVLEFKEKKIKPLITVYYDFESFLIKYNDKEGKKNNKHVPSAFCFFIVSSDEKIYESKKVSFAMTEEKQDIADIFVHTLMSEIRKALLLFHEKGFKLSMTPVLCHNSSGYDNHLFILHLAKYNGYLTILPSTEEKYISFSKYIFISGKKHEIRFLDSYKFLSSSLSSLVEDTEKKKENFYYTLNNFSDVSFDILTSKGYYPYSYMDSFEKTKLSSLPDKKYFYNDLKKQDIKDEEYEHARKAWLTFKCQTMNDYQLKYCKLDVLLLADVFENFRKLNKDTYGLDPLIYGYTLPGTSWNNMLKFTEQKISLITDREIYQDFENGIRGGVSMCVKRYAKANNKYLKNYDPTKKSNFIFYLDKNNLYGEAMSYPLPFAIERKLKKNEFSKWRTLPCVLVCDLEIPEDKKDYLKDFPPAPEHIKVNGVNKLIPNLRDKKEYMVYYRLLKYYEKLGVKITKIHRGYVLKESPWLEPYITNNTKKRSEAEETSKQNYFKLSINSIYGKTIENPRKRSNVELINSEERAQKLIKSPEYISFKIFNQKLVSVTKKKTVINANKPIFIGFCVLEISKLLMYELFYDYLFPKFGNRMNLLYTDTDSFILNIESDDIYEELKNDLNVCFDTSKYPVNHPLYSTKNKNRLGFFKDETKGNPIKEYVSTCAKCYAIKEEKNDGTIKDTLKLKGIVENCIKSGDITFQDYKDCIFEDKEKSVTYKSFKSENHVIYTEKFDKIALNPNQDVRIVLEDKISTIPIGYY